MILSNRLALASLAQNSTKKELPRCIPIASKIQKVKIDSASLSSVITARVTNPALFPPTITKIHNLKFLKINKIASQRTKQVSRHLYSSLPSLDRMSYGKQPSEFSFRKVGAPNTLEFRAFIEKDGTPVSPFHDVPLYANEQQTVLNMIVEIPRWTNAKLEVCCHHLAT